MFYCLILRNIINGRSVLDSSCKFKENCKDERKHILCEIFYIVNGYMSGKNQNIEKSGMIRA